MQSVEIIGILAHPYRPESIPVARQIAEQTRSRGVKVWLEETWNEEIELQQQIKGSHLLLAIGGDGAMLHAARLCAPFSVPVLGVNIGYLGFLTETSPEAWENCLDLILKGQYWIETRLMITGEIWHEGNCIAREDALNDVVVSRGAVAKSVHLEAYIDGAWATNYNADGLVIATATGSTAYALATGGPILPPELDNILMIPVAPHLSMERPVVLSQGVTVRIVVSPRTQTETVVTVDGRSTARLVPGDVVLVRASENRSLFLRLQERNYFFRSLMDRMEPRFSPRHPDENEGTLLDEQQ